MHPDGSTMPVQQVLSQFIYRQRPCGQSRAHTFFTITTTSGALLKAVQAVGLLVDLSQDSCLGPRPGFGALPN